MWSGSSNKASPSNSSSDNAARNLVYKAVHTVGRRAGASAGRVGIGVKTTRHDRATRAAAAYAAGENYFPDDMPRPNFYQPTEYGLEAKIRAKLAELRALDEAARRKK